MMMMMITGMFPCPSPVERMIPPLLYCWNFSRRICSKVFIVSFVGGKQYRFIAGVNRSFHDAYLRVFSRGNETALNASTVELAKFCWNEAEQHHRQYPVELCCSAATHGNLSSLPFLHSVDYEWDETTCAAAAGGGHLNVLKWCRENACQGDAWTCTNAAEHGQLNILIWCRENGCPWDESTCSEAARNGHLIILQRCRENDCPWDDRAYIFATREGHSSVAQWCQENGCPMPT